MLHELVTTYQKHNHSKTCRKYKNIPCRFNFGQFFTDRTIVAEPLSSNLCEEVKTGILTRRASILGTVKSKIDEILNPSKSEYNPNLTAAQVLATADFSEQDYFWALSVSADSDYELHLKRSTDSCFINNYFVAGVQGFVANVDLQPVFNHYKCITYVCSYYTKDETECSQTITNAAKEARNYNLSVRDSLRKVGAAFLSTREVSAQECVYRCMPELWLRKTFPKTIFVSTDLPQNRLRIPKSQDELDELEDDSTDIFKSNIIERYCNRPTSIALVDKLCLAEFASHFYKDYTNRDEMNDAQPDVLTVTVAESQHTDTDSATKLPNKIRLLNTNEVIKCRKIGAVIRLHTPNKQKEHEKCFHHLHMLYFPWRNKLVDLVGTQETYASKFCEPEVQAIVDLNREKFEPDAEAVVEALEFLRNNNLCSLHSYDSLNDQQNEDMQSEWQDKSPLDKSFNEQPPEHLAQAVNPVQSREPGSGVVSHNQPSNISDDILRESVRSLNSQQRCAYDTF